MHMSKHFTDNIVKTELIVESKVNIMVNEKHVILLCHTTDLYYLSFTDNRSNCSGLILNKKFKNQ